MDIEYCTPYGETTTRVGNPEWGVTLVEIHIPCIGPQCNTLSQVHSCSYLQTLLNSYNLLTQTSNENKFVFTKKSNYTPQQLYRCHGNILYTKKTCGFWTSAHTSLRQFMAFLTTIHTFTTREDQDSEYLFRPLDEKPWFTPLGEKPRFLSINSHLFKRNPGFLHAFKPPPEKPEFPACIHTSMTEAQVSWHQFTPLPEKPVFLDNESYLYHHRHPGFSISIHPPTQETLVSQLFTPLW